MSFEVPTMIPGNWLIAQLPSAAMNGGRIVNVTDDTIQPLRCIYWSDGTNWYPKRTYAIQSATLTTNAAGNVTWNYPAAFSSPPEVVGVAIAPTPGSTDVVNVQLDSAPTTTQAVFKVTRTQQSLVALIGLTILSIPASVGPTVIHAIAKLIA